MEYYLKAIVMGIVEGLTEFLPISSTGHLILTEQLIHFNYLHAKLFEVVIQSGAIFAVCWIYRERLFRLLGAALGGAQYSPQTIQEQRQLFWVLAVAFCPLALLGLKFHKWIKAMLFHAVPVAIAFIVGGIIILWMEKRPQKVKKQRMESITLIDALKLGGLQALALIPGTSRSGATIIGGMFLGLSRSLATEFSFFLAIPTLFMASLYELWKARHEFVPADTGILLVGTLAAFLSAWVVVKILIRWVGQHNFIPFAWYRIAFGVVILVTNYLHIIQWQD
jgi:undecaprenyl-diphosphatase